MKQRSPIVAALLSIFMPFLLYWLYVTAKAMERRGSKVPSLFLVFAPFFGVLAVVLVLVVLAALGITATDSTKNIIKIVSLLVGAVLLTAAVVCPLVYFYKFSAAAEQVTSGKINKIVGSVLFFLISPASVYIIQDALNNLNDSPSPSPLDAGTNTPVPPIPGSTPPASTFIQ